MSLEALHKAIRKTSTIHRIIETIDKKILNHELSLTISGVSGSVASLIPLQIQQHKQSIQRILYICNTNDNAKDIYYDLLALSTNQKVILLTHSEQQLRLQQDDLDESIVNNIDMLASLQVDQPIIIVATPDIFQAKVPTPNELIDYTISLKKGNTLPFKEFTNAMMLQGFERRDLVENQGDISIRGGIVDIFPLGFDAPIRIEFWGDDIDSIREFDPSSQRSIREMDTIDFVAHLYHQQEHEFTANILDYVSKDQTIIVFDNLVQTFHFQPLEQYNKIFYTNQLESDIIVNTVDQPNFSASVSGFAHNLRSYAYNEMTIFLCADGVSNLKRFKDLLLTSFEHEQYLDEPTDDLLSTPEQTLRKIKWFDSSVSKGFILPDDNICVFTEHQLFERQHFQTGKRGKRFTGITLRELAQLHRGDFVVHIEKGIGQYDGLVTIEINKTKQECARILYLGGDVLFVHLNNIHKIQKYAGQEQASPRLSKLGSSEWEKKKQKTKKRLKDIARELIKLYAKRKSEPGFSFPVDTQWQKEFEASFMYEDTPDQSKATLDVKKDMESTLPMDRLVCGDVGFGKTEVAIRAAFKAVQAGKQVAVLVPTTILAHQHFNTFSDRLRRYPVSIDVISRFRTSAEQKSIIDNLKSSKIDILIGTHRILSKDIQFNNLGLLIIDEEQRFGVTAKEKLRQMRVSVDSLTLTATPIPRTLNFSLMGARDLSIIETPPRNRLPVNTLISEWDNEKLKEYIERELARGGQLFFVNDNISQLDALHMKLLAIVPSLRCATAHGQMETEKLEDVMERFLERKIDCLLSTKIVESGLDIPNANTIIIHNADNFGLAELYQLRGRVGRSNTQAYCMLIIPPVHTITPQAVKRLQALEEFTELGSGFHLSMRDLEIRGAGNLLGAEQSGFIADMGFELYQQILEEAVSELRTEEFSDLFKDHISLRKSTFKPNKELSIDIGTDSLIPSSYIGNDTERFEYYKRLYDLRSEIELQTIISELRDRFGTMPAEAENLIFAVQLRVISMDMGFTRVVFKNNVLLIEFPPDNTSAFYETIFPYILDAVSSGNYGKLVNTGSIVQLHIPANTDEDAIEILRSIKHHITVADHTN